MSRCSCKLGLGGNILESLGLEPTVSVSPSVRTASRRKALFRSFDSTIVSLSAGREQSSAESPAIRRQSPGRTTRSECEVGICFDAASGSTRRRSNVSSVGGSSGSAVRLILAFHCASSRKYASSGSSIAQRDRRLCAPRASRKTVAKFQRCHVRRRRQPADEHAKDRDSGWGHAGNSERLTERVRPDLGQPLDDLARESWNPVERKIVRDSRFARPSGSARFRSPDAEDSPRTSRSFRRSRCRASDRARSASNSGSRSSASRSASRTSGCRSSWLPETRSPDEARTSVVSSICDVSVEATSSLLEPLPALIVHQTRSRGRAASGADRRCRSEAAADAPRAT